MAGSDRPGVAKRSSASDLIALEDRDLRAAFGEKIRAAYADDARAYDRYMWLGISYQLSALSYQLSVISLTLPNYSI